MNWLIKLLGGWTQEEYSKMHSHLGKRFEEQYWSNRATEEQAHKMYKVAMDVATKYNDEEAIKKIMAVMAESQE